MKKRIFKLLLILFLMLPSLGSAHVSEQSYIFLRVYEKDGIEGRFEVQTRDLNKVFGWGLKTNGTSPDDLEPYISQIKAYFLKNSAFSSALGPHKVVLGDVSILPTNLGDFVQLHFKLEGISSLPDALDVTYSAVFDKAPKHRGYLVVEYNWKAGVINNEAIISLDFKPGKTTSTLSLTEASVTKGFIAMIKQGVWHIWIGLDHILFLLALILPSVVRRVREANESVGKWAPVERFKPAFIYIIKVITFFTIAHTITLSLAALQIVNLPSRLVESVIALSIGLAAYHNIRPIFKGRDWVIAFVFGLFHGFGFASVLGDLGLKNEFLTLSLLGFNIGVEIGQVAIIFLIFPVLYLIRKFRTYPRILSYGSVLLIFISLYWVVERVFDVNLGVEDSIRSLLYRAAVFLGLR
ncbi:hypothetical protein GWK08_09540 [Leptobacterium flavescens]|uniref:HupE/UreJ family protein n=1 Tax=Leptobacterium flavescens TaxID=472055 RepID=A0A6P0UMJ8_9FLAO|nr:HupE/UreJ family protein [Leptobacterium flavescens]NER13680.1 hypothetical protein [Leptobacterium flavescens]